MMSPDETARLVLVKYYLSVAADHARQPEPLSSVALLLAHDACEHFLRAAAGHVNADIKERTAFMDYWDLINAMLVSDRLPLRESMDRLNRARVGLKHSGILPSTVDLQTFVARATDFVSEATAVVFSSDFASLSLTDLVTSERVRNHMKNAERMNSEDKRNEALCECARAFYVLMHEHRAQQYKRFRHRSFDEARTGRGSCFVRGIKSNKLADYVDELSESLGNMQEKIAVLSLGVDPEKYERFRLLTPYVSAISLDYILAQTPPGPVDGLAQVDVSFCISFVIENALRLQQRLPARA